MYKNRSVNQFNAVEKLRPLPEALERMSMHEFYNKYYFDGDYIVKRHKRKRLMVVVFMPGIQGHDKSSAKYARYCKLSLMQFQPFSKNQPLFLKPAKDLNDRDYIEQWESFVK